MRIKFFRKQIYLFRNLIDTIDCLRVADTYASLAKCDVLFCCHDLDRGETRDGKAYSKLIDSLQEEFSARGFKTESFSHSYSRITGPKSWSNSLSANRALFAAAILRRLWTTLGLLRVTINARDFRQEVYVSIFKKCSPKVIITIGSPPSFCRAARSLNIKVCEILHGIGYTPIPWGWERTCTTNLPDIIWSLDPISTQTFKPLESRGIITRQIPHPFYSRFSYPIYERISTLPKEWVKWPKSLSKKGRIILVSLQWGYDGDFSAHDHFNNILSNGLVPIEIIELIERLGDDYFWLFRLHPEQYRAKKYQYQKNFLIKLSSKYSNCEWELSTSLPLPLLLKHCIGHISMASMTAYDAAFMSVKTLLLCPTLAIGGIRQNMFSDLVSLGYAVKSPINYELIKNWVQSAELADQPLSFTSSNDWEHVMRELFE